VVDLIEPRIRDISVTEEQITVSLTDGPSVCPWLGHGGFQRQLLIKVSILRLLETVRAYIGRILTKISVRKACYTEFLHAAQRIGKKAKKLTSRGLPALGEVSCGATWCSYLNRQSEIQNPNGRLSCSSNREIQQE